MLKSYLKQDNVVEWGELDLNVKFPLLRLLQFLSDSKSTKLKLRKNWTQFLFIL